MTSTPVQRRPSAQKRMSVALQEGVAANTESLTALGVKGEFCRAFAGYTELIYDDYSWTRGIVAPVSLAGSHQRR